ncbi:Pre-rRNA-processing protein TSR2 [Leucoagaricus sp. SymC.cos]|nr:Pre-rRNA-processing protein TSR2 [Leucoagaricus sp. SymC.cos]
MASTSTSTPTPTPAPSPQSVLFARGVLARLAIWSTLRIAVQENWGGPDAKHKPAWIASTIVDSFEEESEQPDEQYIEEMLLQIMADEFEAVLEDDSAASVAKDVVKMWVEIKAGKEDTVKKFEEFAERIKGKNVEVKESVESDDDWSDDEDGEDYIEDDDETPQLIEHQVPQAPRKAELTVDEDGFTLVQGKGKGKGRR